MANVRWIQVLESKAPIEIVLHWQAWFDSNGIKHAIRPYLKGPALSRAMTRTEYAAFRAIEGSYRSDRKSPKKEAARLRAETLSVPVPGHGVVRVPCSVDQKAGLSFPNGLPDEVAQVWEVRDGVLRQKEVGHA